MLTDAAAWLRRPASRPDATVRLYCFAHSGAGASTFRRWPQLLPQDVEVCAVQLPGREDRLAERPCRSVQEAVDSLLPSLDVTRPYALFGHSIGALLAFETARAVRRSGGREPVALMVSGSSAPHLEDTEPPLSTLPDEELLEQLQRLKGTPEAVLQDAELMALLLPVLRGDFELYESYAYRDEPPLACPIEAFGGEADVRVPVEDLDQWAAHTTSSFSRHMFHGDHFFVQSALPLLLATVGLTVRRHVQTLRE
jgi:medium-chain acyl-[acyl-carrier-protein] hydrolase